MPERVLVTGALGCLGAWVARCVLDDGDAVVGYDLGDDRSRLELVLGATPTASSSSRATSPSSPPLERALDEHEITRVIHLAALQVPFVRANPPLGMHVNVAGTVNVFDAVSRRLDRIPCVAYASSAAVYNPSDPSPAPETRRDAAGDALRRLEACRRGHRPRLPGRRRCRLDRAATVRRLRPGPRPGHDVRPDGGDARRGSRASRSTSASRARLSTTSLPTSPARP